jgi:hypothetical protein
MLKLEMDGAERKLMRDAVYAAHAVAATPAETDSIAVEEPTPVAATKPMSTPAYIPWSATEQLLELTYPLIIIQNQC